MEAPSLQLQIGQTLARDYRVLRALAAGGMGSVYLVEQLSTGKQRALKVMHPQYARDEESRARFAQEAKAGARIKSEHVVEVVAAGVDDETGIPWLAMELLDGEELSARVRRAGRLPAGEVLEIFRQLGHGLGEAHRQGLVHRDLKPENIFIAVARRESAPFTLKILDFGVAKLAQESQAQDPGTRPVGTPRWMAPEQSEERGRITPATDVWAMGLLAFYLLTGRFYWRAANGGSLTTLLRELVLEPIEPPSARAAALGLGTALPQGFDDWFARCVVRDPAARFPDADAAMRALVPLLESAPAWDARAIPLVSQSSAAADSGDGATLGPRLNEGASTRSGVGATQSGAGATTPPKPGAATRPPAPSAAPTGPLQPAPAAPPAPVAPAPAKRTVPILLGAAAVVAVALFFALRPANRPAPAPPAAAPQVAPTPAPAPAAPKADTFALYLESIPSGAEVFEGESDLGTTPLQLSLDNAPLAASPRHFRIVKEGYQPYSLVQGPSHEAVKVIATLGPAEEAAPKKAVKSHHDAPPAEGEPELRLRR